MKLGSETSPCPLAKLEDRGAPHLGAQVPRQAQGPTDRTSEAIVRNRMNDG